MRGVVFLCIALLAGLPLGAETRIVETAGSGVLVESTPSAATVFVDGIERGLTPLTLGGASPGVHTLRVTKDWYVDWTARITVPARGRLELFIDLRPAEGTIAVNVMGDGGDFPGGARIFLNGVEVEGREFSVPEGWWTVKVSAFGWQDAQKSVFVLRNETTSLDFDLKRAAFELGGLRMSRSVLNPAGSGAQIILAVDFTVSAQGTGRFVVSDDDGSAVFSAPLGQFERAEQRYVWDGRGDDGELLEDGAYRIHIEAEGAEGGALKSVAQALRIDSALDEGPLSLGSGLPGLFLVPVSGSHAGGTFQVEAGIVLGRPAGEGHGFDALPFSAALSFTPADRWLLAAAINMRPGKDGLIDPSVSGSVKRELRKPAGLLPGAAAFAAYGWVKDGFVSAFGIKSGAQLGVPLSWRVGRRLSLHAAPALLWTGGDGYPEEPSPRVVLSGGLLSRFRLVSAGLSFQTVSTFSDGVEEFCPAALSAEFRFTPPRSSLNIGLLAGVFFNGDDRGGYGGLSIGALF
ncbi:MAG: PEGA domain-containing protein [Spirochaetaceae bacterium]|jgi:hypothetical protein|nr:PEGA domain-containing protein [Spirochaetaceae bacterium]